MELNVIRQISTGLTLPHQDLSGYSGALAQSITVVDHQVKTILSISNAPDDLPNADQINQSLNNYHTAAQGWEPVRNELVNTLTLISDLAGSAKFIDNIPDFLLTVHSIQLGLKGILTAVNLIEEKLQGSLGKVQNIENTVDASYRDNAHALQSTSDQINLQTQQLDDQISNLNHEIDDLDSAGSIVIAVLTVGISAAVKIHDINNEIDDCRDKQQRLNYYRQLFDQVNLMVASCRGAMKTTSIALTGVNTTVQQVSNQLKGMHASDNPSLVVMKAFLETFKKQAEDAAEKINNALN